MYQANWILDRFYCTTWKRMAISSSDLLHEWCFHRSGGFFWYENILYWKPSWVWCWDNDVWSERISIHCHPSRSAKVHYCRLLWYNLLPAGKCASSVNKSNTPLHSGVSTDHCEAFDNREYLNTKKIKCYKKILLEKAVCLVNISLLKFIPYQELPKDGVKIFQGVLHSHLLGTSIVLRHIRNGHELPIIMKGESAGTEPPGVSSLSTSQHLCLTANISCLCYDCHVFHHWVNVAIISGCIYKIPQIILKNCIVCTQHDENRAM